MQFAIATISFLSVSASAFSPNKVQRSPFTTPSIFLPHQHGNTLLKSSFVKNSKLYAGFGGGGGKGGKKKGKKSNKGNLISLKPKPQWDRYGKLKKSNAVSVAVRVANAYDDSEKGDWYEVGRVKSEGDQFTELAVAMQRGIIAEHAKRLYPLQFLAKDKVEWAYATIVNEVENEWTSIDKTVTNEAPTGVEKKIGFEGKPDAATGFYCHYQDGRLVDKYDEGKSLSRE